MRPKSLILLVMALGCGLIAAVGINQIMARPSGEAETTTIVVAKREVLKGDLIKPDDIRLQEWRKDALPEGAIEKIEDLQDKRVKSTIISGEPILAGKLLSGKGDSIDIPPGMKAVTVKVDNVSGGAGLIFPGDNVDVLVHAEKNEQRGIMATTTKRMLQNIKVLAVDDTVERPAPGEPSIAAKTVSLLVNDKDAMRVTLATEIGKIFLVMRSTRGEPADEESVVQGGVNIQDVLGESAIAPSAKGSTPSTANISHLPPTEEGLGKTVSEGAKSFIDLIKEMNKAHTEGITEEKKSWKVVLLEGPEAKEVEFTGDSRLGKSVGTPTGPSPSGQDTDSGSPALETKMNLQLPPSLQNKEAAEKKTY